MDNTITFHIQNEAYTVNLGDDMDAPLLKKELLKFLSDDTNVGVKDLLTAYIRKSQELLSYKKEISRLSQKLPDVE